MKKTIFVILGFLAIALAAFVVARSNADQIVDPNAVAKVGDQCPSFTVQMLDGEVVSIEALRGKTVLINFWATWCPPCNEEMTRVEKEIVERFADEEFVFLPISRGEEPEVVSAWRTKKGYKFDTGLDIATEIFPLFAKSDIPRNYLIGPDGTILHYEVGYEPEHFDELVKRIDETIQNAKK